MASYWAFLYLVTSLIGGLSFSAADRTRLPCTDRFGNAQRCIPPFVNAAYQLPVEASNTCGQRGPTQFCLQTGITGSTKDCDTCDVNYPSQSHPPSHLTDFHRDDYLTWWQSETMLEGIQYPSTVNLTLKLGKAFDITYVRLKFFSSRPESFSIYKRTTDEGDWIPYQYYSASCQATYNRRPREIIPRGDETKAICTDEFSDISPLTGGSVAFSTLEGRPSAYDFENSPVLQKWVSATQIKIVLSRMNSFGDEVFGDPNVLKSYFYAISDFAVGGRCKCNGHASQCVQSTGQGLEPTLVCQCEHNTAGVNCEECLPFYQNMPWHRATATDAHVCEACDCSNLSNRCYFDEELFRRTGSGGHCLDCRGNTAGVHCERCKDNFYRRNPQDRCEPCVCHSEGSLEAQCDQSGRCRCKEGVTGEKCDRCMPNFFELGPSGCRPCACEVAGSLNNNPECLPDTGTCTCKENVEGQNCDQCKPGYFGMHLEDQLGCMACFCYGHSSICTVAPDYAVKVITAEFTSGKQKWKGESREGEEIPLQYNSVTESIGISGDQAYFVAPDRFLMDHRFAYNQFLGFSLRVGEDGARASVLDVVIEGSGHKVSTPIFSQGNPVPRIIDQEYKFRLHEHPIYQWTPSLSANEFHSMLANLTSIKIRGTYTAGGVGFLDNVKFDTARQGSGEREALNVEQCTCPDGYVGQFCESCAPGFHRDPPNGGPLTRCIPCNCNGHSDICDVESGQCICQHNTVGDNCERCAPGYYGYARTGTPEDCQECPCPNNGECVELLNGEVACINCKEGYTGNRCDICADGYYGDPAGRYGARRPCIRCDCNDNIDPNAVANCNTTSGECVKCIYNTGGWNCDRCLTGYYGNALSIPKGDCQACNCHLKGSLPSGSEDTLIECDSDGQCPCQVRVTGMQCDMCVDGYWNIDSGNGCERCSCDLTGSYNRTCDITTGQCFCRENIASRRCDACSTDTYGFSSDGCRDCMCYPEGSSGTQCELSSGQCPCHDSVEGRTCDRCIENKYNITAGCVDCPPCYKLVQDHVNNLRDQLKQLKDIITHIGDNPQAINDTDFRAKMMAVNTSVVELWNDAHGKVPGDDGSLSDQLEAIRAAVTDLVTTCSKINTDVTDARRASDNGVVDITAAEKAIEDAQNLLKNAEDYINNEGQDALEKAREAQKKFGQQSDRMTQIAKEAREEAERQEEEALLIEETAQKALNTSKEAWNTANDAVIKPDEIKRELDDVDRDIVRADDLFERAGTMAEDAKDKAVESYKESLNIYTEVDSIRVPDINVQNLNDRSNNIKEEAASTKEEAQRLMEQSRQLMEDVEKQQKEAEDLLKEGTYEQQKADELLADADGAKAIAMEAIEKAEKTLKDADETLKTLEEFDQKVQESKDEAEKALLRSGEIEDRIREAEDVTEEANENLDGAIKDAQAAKSIAEVAETQAQTASEDAQSIRQEASDTKDRATDLKDGADKLSADVNEAGERLARYEQQADEDENLASEALQKADSAATAAEDSSKKVAEALSTVEMILQNLADLDNVDTGRLDDLENNLNDAERRLIAADIETRYEGLITSTQQQRNWVKDYTAELIQLRQDVDNIRHINETIPRKCFKANVLEPIDPSG